MRTISRGHRFAAVAAVATVALGLAACSPEDTEPAGTSTGSGGETLTQESIVASGPVASDDVVEANEWASSVREAGELKVGGTETSELFSLLDPTTGQVTGFDAGISQLLAHYILGEDYQVDLTQVTVDTRESLLESSTVDVVVATYSITPARAERIGFAGPYYSSEAAILVASDNDSITDLDDLAGKKVATQANSTGVELLEEYAPDAEVVALPDHAQALAAVQQGNVDAYVIDQTLLLNAVIANDDVKIVGEPFGPGDLYGIGVNKDSDAVEFINAFLEEIESSGAWDDLWKLTIGDRTGLTEVPTPPTPGDTGL